VTRALVLLAIALCSGCTTYDLSAAPTKSLGVAHIFERLPCTAKIGTFRDSTPERALPPALLSRATEAFALSLKRTELFEKVVTGGGEPAELGLDAEILAYTCTRNYAFIWAFYSALALIAVPANLPLSIDEGEYSVRLHVFESSSGRLVSTYDARFYARSWRGAWTLYSSFLDEPEQVFDKVDHDLIRALLDDYQKLAPVAGSRPSSPR
jgi:hypothetical protein